MVTGLSTLTLTNRFVLVRGEYRRPFTYGLLVSASVRPHRSSGHEADSLTCDHLSNRPSYRHDNRCNDDTFDEVFHTGDYLFIWCYWSNFAKSPCISARTSSVRIEIGAGDGDRTRDPLLGKQIVNSKLRPYSRISSTNLNWSIVYMRSGT